MTNETVELHDLIQILKKAGKHTCEYQDYIRELDAACGDGDLGITVKRGFTAVEKLLSEIDSISIEAILKQIGMEFNNAAASTFGVFFATAFIEAGKEIGSKSQINPQDLKAMFKAACVGIKRRGGAKVGDKTMLDALVPATEGVEEVAKENGSIYEAFEAAAKAAEDGAENTRGMKPKTGRAKQLGEKTKEAQDPGATVVYLFLEGIVSNFP